MNFIGKNTKFPPFWRLKSSFSYFRIFIIQEIDFRDFGNSENRILDIGFRILTFRILTFRILTFGILTFTILTFRILIFGITNSGFWTVILSHLTTCIHKSHALFLLVQCIRLGNTCICTPWPHSVRKWAPRRYLFESISISYNNMLTSPFFLSVRLAMAAAVINWWDEKN